MARSRRADPLTQLAASVLAGETTQLPWALLRHSYFDGTHSTALRHLEEWASKYRIAAIIEPQGPEGEVCIRFKVL